MKNMLIVAVVACLLGISTARASEDDDFTIICHTRAQIEDIVSHDVKGDMTDAMRAYKKYAAPPKSDAASG